jgi:hypothetical protein
MVGQPDLRRPAKRAVAQWRELGRMLEKPFVPRIRPTNNLITELLGGPS